MSPAPMSGPAYWASGGEVRGRRGPLTRGRAVELAGFLDREAGRACGDPALAGALRRMARDVRRAIAAADGWRRAAAGLGPLHFVRDANSLEHG